MTPDPEGQAVPRCARGWLCADAEQRYLADPGAPRRFRFVGAELTRPGRAFCEADVRFIGYTIRALALDVAELSLLLVPSQAIHYREPDMPVAPRIKLHSPLPLDAHPEGLRALVDYEVTTWAIAVAEAAGVPWDEKWTSMSRLGHRVHVGAELMVAQLDHLLGLPATTYRCRSAGEHPTDGHDDEAVTYDGRDYWITRDGTDAALLLIDLHDRVERLVGRIGSDRLKPPCPDPRCRGHLVREHARGALFGVGTRTGEKGTVLCRRCWKSMTDDEFEVAEKLWPLRLGPYAPTTAAVAR